ncbi:MAG: effector binding domain-containing protein [Clostridia bacterium]|nr:effector binding domain-containing protein [Clostridia bacterium]
MLTVTEVSRSLDVSTRMLRYYEQQELIVSQRREGYAYRLYDEENVNRLRLILVLRRLRVPLKDIARFLSDCDASQALAVLRERIAEVDEELHTLETIRRVLSMFAERIGAQSGIQERLALLGDEALLSTVRALGLSNEMLKEKIIMSELNQADQARWKTLNIRYVMLPPCTVAAFHYVGADPEEHVGDMTSRFVQESRLYEHKPDARMFGFNHPDPAPERKHYGYENWVTIPDDMDVPSPGMKLRIPGGLYAAHTIDFPNFHEWEWLVEWAEHNEKYAPNWSPEGPENMHGMLEEHLNWIYAAHNGWPEDGLPGRIDLLLPIKKR